MRTPRPDAVRSQSLRKTTPEDVDLAGVVPLKAHPEKRETPDPADEKSPTSTERQIERVSERKAVRTEPPSSAELTRLPLKRLTKRYSFEFYEDQIKKVKQLKIQAEMAGLQLSLSDMVRAALDDYLRDK